MREIMMTLRIYYTCENLAGDAFQNIFLHFQGWCFLMVFFHRLEASKVPPYGKPLTPSNSRESERFLATGAPIAQWQSTGLVNLGSGVRSSLGAEGTKSRTNYFLGVGKTARIDNAK